MDKMLAHFDKMLAHSDKMLAHSDKMLAHVKKVFDNQIFLIIKMHSVFFISK